MSNITKWPKILAPLSPDQISISDDFMSYWHHILPKHYKIVDYFNQSYSVKNTPLHFEKTLEIGAGLGEHLNYEILTEKQEKNYYSLELRSNMAAEIKKNFPKINVIAGDCQQRLDFSDGYFDRILAIHILEHLPNLPSAIQEIYRLCNKKRGILSVVIPCEGGLFYSFARKISAQRIFEKRYKQSYCWFYEREHINLPNEIFEELNPYFKIQHIQYFPLWAKFEWCNLCIGITLSPK